MNVTVLVYLDGVAAIHDISCTGLVFMDWWRTGHRAGIFLGLIAAAALIGVLNITFNGQVKEASLMQTSPGAAQTQQLYQVGDQEYLPLNEGSPEDMTMEIEKIIAKEKILLAKLQKRAKKHRRVEIRVEAGQVRKPESWDVMSLGHGLLLSCRLRSCMFEGSVLHFSVVLRS